jgi:2'-5' RNA ligase
MPKRLFAAIDLPDSITDAIADLDPRVPDVRWVKSDHMHLTLGFFGVVDDEPMTEFADRLRAIHFGAFFLPVREFGMFPSKGPPRIVWVGVGHGHPHLFQVHKRVQEAAMQSGLEPDLRPWHPHITIARCREISRPAADKMLRKLGEADFSMFRVDAFRLYSSQLTPAGSIYTIECEVPASLAS